MLDNSLTHLFPLAILTIILYKAVTHLLIRQRNVANARKLGCGSVPTLTRPWWDLLNLVSLLKLFHAAQEGLLFTFFKEQYFDRIRQITGINHRTFSSSRAGSTTILTFDSDNIKTLLSTNREDYSLGRRQQWFGPLIGRLSFFTIDGEAWAHDRAIIKPALMKEHFSNLLIAEKHNENLSQVITTEPASRWTATIDLMPLFFRMTMDSSTEFLWGESVDSQLTLAGDASGAKDHFATAYDEAQEMISKRMIVDSLYWLRDSPSFRRACRICHNKLQPHIARVLGTSKSSKSRYVLMEELAQSTRSAQHLQDTAMGMLLAGRDTTATLLGWLFYYLARHPQSFASLRSSIIADFGNLDDAGEITFEKLKACKLLQWSLFEALRLRPPVPLNGFNAVRDTVLPTGGGENGTEPIFVSKGTRVAYVPILLHTDPTTWGPDAHEWQPERWATRKHGWNYVPFNGGPRICPGQQYALTLAAYTTVKLLQRFDGLENCDPDPLTRMTPTLVSFSKNGVLVRLHEAQGPDFRQGLGDC